MRVLERMKAAAPGETVKDEGEKTSVQGLELRALATKKTFMLYYRSRDGVQRRPRIGDFGAMTLAQARSIARDILDRVARGEDPQGEWREARAEMTVAELFDRAWADHWSKPRFQKSGWSKDVENFWKRNVKPHFGAKRLGAIEKTDVRQWHLAMEDTPIAANRSLEILNKMFNFAEEAGIRPRHTNPCWKVKPFVEAKRKRYASHDEIKKIFEILARETPNHPRACAFLYLVMMTGSRPSAIERARWGELKRVTHEGETYGVLSFQGKTTADSGEEETVVVPPMAMAILDRLPRGKDSDRILGINLPKKFWNKVRTEAGCTDLWARDLRRTFATVGLSGGVGKDVIGKLLNHTSAETTDLYAKLDYSARMQAVSKIANRIQHLSLVQNVEDRQTS